MTKYTNSRAMLLDSIVTPNDLPAGERPLPLPKAVEGLTGPHWLCWVLDMEFSYQPAVSIEQHD